MTFKALFQTRSGCLRLILLAAALIGTAVLAPTVHASIITVNTTEDELNDDGDCSLREAIIAANTDTAVSGCQAGNGFDVIDLPAGTYTLSLSGSGEDEAATGDLDITERLALDGAGRVTTTIHGNGADRVFDIDATGDVDIHGVTITRGHVNNDVGGGILVRNGRVSLVNSRLTDNSIGGGTYQGGGMTVGGGTVASLYNVTIANNIAFGLESVSEEQIVQATKDAAVYDNIVAFEHGFNTSLGERGLTLSGGQKQRVSIARALIKQPQILVFDDCLSAVDTSTEEQILQNLSRVMAGKSSIFISHRVSTIKNADRILVLDQGRVIEEGTHEELLQHQGAYFELHEKQLLEEMPV